MVGDIVTLAGCADGCIVPDGKHVVSKVNPDGSFHVGGWTAVWPHRVTGTIPNLKEQTNGK